MCDSPSTAHETRRHHRYPSTHCHHQFRTWFHFKNHSEFSWRWRNRLLIPTQYIRIHFTVLETELTVIKANPGCGHVLVEDVVGAIKLVLLLYTCVCMHVCVSLISRPNTILVTIMLANNETGVLQVYSVLCTAWVWLFIVVLACKGNLVCFSHSKEGAETHSSILTHRFSSGIHTHTSLVMRMA